MGVWKEKTLRLEYNLSFLFWKEDFATNGSNREEAGFTLASWPEKTPLSAETLPPAASQLLEDGAPHPVPLRCGETGGGGRSGGRSRGQSGTPPDSVSLSSWGPVLSRYLRTDHGGRGRARSSRGSEPAPLSPPYHRRALSPLRRDLRASQRQHFRKRHSISENITAFQKTLQHFTKHNSISQNAAAFHIGRKGYTFRENTSCLCHRPVPFEFLPVSRQQQK